MSKSCISIDKHESSDGILICGIYHKISSRSDSNAHQNSIPDLAWKLFLFKEPVSAEINMLEACWIRHRFPYRQTYEKLEEPNPVMSTREHLPFGNHLNLLSASREEALTKKQRGSETGAKTKKGIKSGARSKTCILSSFSLRAFRKLGFREHSVNQNRVPPGMNGDGFNQIEIPVCRVVEPAEINSH